MRSAVPRLDLPPRPAPCSRVGDTAIEPNSFRAAVVSDANGDEDEDASDGKRGHDHGRNHPSWHESEADAELEQCLMSPKEV